MKKFFAVLVLMACLILPLFAQKQGKFKATPVSATAGGSAGLNLPSIGTLNKQVKSAKVIVFSNFSNNPSGEYRFGKSGTGTDFNVRVDFTLTANNGAIPVFTKNYSFELNNASPEGFLSKDFSDMIVTPGALTLTGLEFSNVEISNISVTDIGSTPSFAQAISSLHLHMIYDLDMGIDVSGKGSEITIFQPTLVGHKVAKFNWNTTYVYPNYQFQLLRLYNNNSLKKDDKFISTTLDWSKAVLIETESDLKELSLTIAEGTGFYAWRVRPIGTFYNGGIGHSGNWGNWNGSAPANGSNVNLPSLGNVNYFFFLDPDDDINYIYSRTFTEENRIKESISYANSLLQEKQSQVYIPSDNTTITTQSIQDHLGRPALKTLPVPQNGKLSGYKENLVTTNGGELYSEKHFDVIDKDEAIDNVNNPSIVDPSTPVGSYYSGNSDVPSAQGYPYSRVVFYNDGTGRVKEQSGVGKEHMVGSLADGRGRTVKTFYSTPSQDELWALFGSESPNHEKVQKTITVDQNNIASITYTGSDGKVIATALSFLEGTSTNLLPLQDDETSVIHVSDKLVGGVKTDDAFVSAKRVTLTETTPLAFEYLIECETFSKLCADIDLDCGYEARIIIHNVDDPTKDIILSKEIKDIPCGPVVEVCNSNKEYKVVTSDMWTLVSPTGGAIPTSLAPGTYIFEKKLFPSRNISIDLKNQEEKIENQIGPIKNWIKGSLEAVTCPEQLTIFYNNLITLGNLFNQPGGLASSSINFVTNGSCEQCEGGISFPSTFWEIYTKPELKPEFSIKVYNSNNVEINTVPFTSSPYSVVISTPCCQYIKLNVSYTPPFKCPPMELVINSPVIGENPNVDKNPNGDNTKLDVNYDFLTNPERTEYYPDFEGYAISMLKSCKKRDLNDAIATQLAKKIFYSYMAGWKEGEFNQMVHHMLTDVYSCDGTGNNVPDETINPMPVEVDECTPADQSMINGTQYRCADLAKCWNTLVMMLSNAYCIDQSDLLKDKNEGGSISDGVDDNNEGDGEPHDSHFDEGLEDADIPGLLKWFANRKLSKELRDMQNIEASPDQPMNKPEFTFHMVEMFLSCTGYKFADILEPDLETNCTSGTGIGVVGPYEVPADFNNADPTLSKYNSCPYKANGWKNTYIEVNDNLTPKTDGKQIKDIFPNIQNPIYAFKYYEYRSETYPQLELITCYKDPNDCYEIQNGQKVRVPCCLKTDGTEAFCDRNYDFPDIETKFDGQDDRGKYRLIVKNFCGLGKIECPYTEVDWSCSQREYFYNVLKAYREPTQPFEPEETITCNWMTEPKEWYTLPSQYADETSLDYVDNDLFLSITGSTPSALGVSLTPLAGLAVANGKTDPFSTVDKNTISYVEYEATRKLVQCTGRCDSRRGEFRNAVIQMFVDRCYVFDGCKLSDKDNIVYMEDVEKIVDEIVRNCKTQCPLTTYTCETNECRLINTPYTLTGPNDSFSDLKFGAGGMPNNTTDCPAGVGQMNPCCAASSVNGNLNGSQTIDGLECNAQYNLTWYEYTSWKQAKEWFLDLDIESMCNVDGQYIDADLNGERDNYPLYYFTTVNKTRTLVPHGSDLNCPERLPGTTHVTKSAYEINPNVPLDANRPGPKIESPKIKITVESE